MATKNFDEIVKNMVAKEIAALKKELGSDLKKALSETLAGIFGNSGIGGPLGAGLGNALDSLIAGKKIYARSAANSAATSLAPQIGNLFNQSTSQLGESLTGLFSAAQRNF